MNESGIRSKALESARYGARLVMRYVYRELASAKGPEELEAARQVQRLAVGLSRKLDATAVKRAKQP
jgi:hypothetical protein